MIDHLGLAHTWIGGYESGGTLARMFAAKHVERVNGLLLLGVEDEQIPLAPAIPVLIIQATDDATTSPVNSEKLQALAPERVSITSIDGADQILMEDFIEGFGITQNNLAVSIGVPPRRINEIVHRKRGITADTAIRLAKYFGTSEEFWMNLQSHYELRIERPVLRDRIEGIIPLKVA